MRRTPPPLTPQGWEKCSTHIDIQLTDTEHLLWRSVFGYKKMADHIRRIVNLEAYSLSGVSKESISKEYPSSPKIPAAVRNELKRHRNRMMQLLERYESEKGKESQRSAPSPHGRRD